MLLIVIQARTSSKRLPGKVLMKINNKTILERVINLIKKIKVKKKIYVVTSKLKNDNKIVEIAKKSKIFSYQGSLENVASRFKDVVLKNPKIKFFLRVSSDSPLLDINLITKLLKLRKHDYDIISNVKQRSFPKGQSIEILKSEFFLKNFKKITSKSDKEHVTKKLYKIPNANIYNLKNKINLSKYSLALDTIKDEKFIKFFLNKYNKKMNWYNILKIRINYEKN